VKRFTRVVVYLMTLAYVLAYQFNANWRESNLRSAPVKPEQSLRGELSTTSSE
jgi:hypothetical protein